jgi:serine protease Do
LKDCHDVNVTLYDGREVRGRVVKIDLRRDMTLIGIDSTLDTQISLAGGKMLIGMGERVYSIGCPANLNGSVFSGVMNGPQRRANDQVYWQVNMKIYPGSSGSPVFDFMGNLVAVVKGRYRGTDSVVFLIPLGTIIEFVES